LTLYDPIEAKIVNRVDMVEMVDKVNEVQLLDNGEKVDNVDM
jgi:hypothetical protein